MREREAKLIADRDFEVPDVERLPERVASTTTESLTQHATYYDTADLRLTRAGASLRYRSDDGWTVKLPESRTASSLTRTELNLGGAPGEMPALARSLVRAWTRTSPL